MKLLNKTIKKSKTKSAHKYFIILIVFCSSIYAQWNFEDTLYNGDGVFTYLSAVDSNNVWVVGSSFTSGIPLIYKRTSSGVWEIVSLNGIINQPLTCISAISSTTAFIGAGYGNAVMYKTTNGGNNWQAIFNTGGTSGYFNDIRFSRKNPSYGYAWSDPPAGNGTPFKIYKTANYGQNWTVYDVITNVNYVGAAPSICVTDSNHAWFGLNKNIGGNDYGKILYTSNGGINFSTISLPLLGKFTRAIEFKENNILGITALVEQPNYYFRSSNGGTSWSYFNSSFYFSNCPRIVSVPGSNVWYAVISIVGPNNRLLKSTNDGLNWFSMPLPGNQYQVVFMDAVINGNKVFAYAISIEGYILKLVDTVFLTSISAVGEQIPLKSVLHQNYPNPFNPVTKIKFEIPTPPEGGTQDGGANAPLSFGEGLGVRLVIYDILGREIALLVNKQLKPGTYEVEWDGSGYPSGTYLYRITAGDFTETRKMVMVK